MMERAEPTLAEPTAAAATSVTYRRPQPSVRVEIGRAWASRALLPRLGARVVVKTYVKTIAGRGWLVIRPVMEGLAMGLIFGGVVGLNAPEGLPYLLFLLVGLLGWRLFERSLFWSTRSFDRYNKLTRSMDPPLLLLPIGGTAPGIVEFGVYSVLIALVAAGFSIADGTAYISLGPELLLAVLGVALCYLFSVGLGLFLSVLNARARDVRLTLRYVLDVWVYITPIIYPLGKLPEGFQVLAQVNPVAPMVEMVKEGLLGAGTVTVGGAVWATAATLLALGGGLVFFSRYSSVFVTPLHGRHVADDEEEEDLL